MSLKGRLDTLRGMGWTVAVHNDYRLQGRRYTFWLFTKGFFSAKGEGATDLEALVMVKHQVMKIEAFVGALEGDSLRAILQLYEEI